MSLTGLCSPHSYPPCSTLCAHVCLLRLSLFFLHVSLISPYLNTCVILSLFLHPPLFFHFDHTVPPPCHHHHCLAFLCPPSHLLPGLLISLLSPPPSSPFTAFITPPACVPRPPPHHLLASPLLSPPSGQLWGPLPVLCLHPGAHP